jgi:hypothetical protein
MNSLLETCEVLLKIAGNFGPVIIGAALLLAVYITWEVHRQ